MREFTLGAKRIVIDARTILIGKGAEADVYKISVNTALKVFKPPDHPDFTTLPNGPEKNALISGAKFRLDEMQRKLPEFPTGLPAQLIAPLELARSADGRIAGYSMPLVKDAQLLIALHKDQQLRQNISHQTRVELFVRLHELIEAVHKQTVVIGDFNDLNALVVGTTPYLIDADSMQFSDYSCWMYTTRFVDPLLCDSTQALPVLAKPHRETSDWFAYAVMLFETLLWVHPFGGIHKPKTPARPIPHEARSLYRVSVFHDDVIYPKPARMLKSLPDDLLQHFYRMFEKDFREQFPLALVEDLLFTSCTCCGFTHARKLCPKCSHAEPAIKEKIVIRGNVKATRLFPTPLLRGTVLCATTERRELKWLSIESGIMKRENGQVVLKHAAQPTMNYRISRDRTLIGVNDRVVMISPHDKPHSIITELVHGRPAFDANDESIFWIDQGRLVREGALGIESPELIGTVLKNHTRFWMEDAIGFGFSSAGEYFQAFTFETRAKRSLNDRVDLRRIPGQLVDARAVCSSHVVWFFRNTQTAGKLLNTCTLIDSKGTALAEHQAVAGDGSWLSTIHGSTATTLSGVRGELIHALFVATDRGIVRVDLEQGQLRETRLFADTEPFVDSDSQLFLADTGIFVVNSEEILLVQMS